MFLELISRVSADATINELLKHRKINVSSWLSIHKINRRRTQNESSFQNKGESCIKFLWTNPLPLCTIACFLLSQPQLSQRRDLTGLVSNTRPSCSSLPYAAVVEARYAVQLQISPSFRDLLFKTLKVPEIPWRSERGPQQTDIYRTWEIRA